MLGVVTGLKSEAKLLDGLGLACVSTGGRADVARGKIDRLIAGGATGLVSFGIAGALAPGLRTGDLIIADTVANDIGEVWRTHEPWMEAVASAVAATRSDRHGDAPHHAAARRAEGHATSGPPWSHRDDGPDEAPPPRRGPSVTSAVRPGPSERQGPAARGIRVGGILGLDRMLSSPQEKAEAFTQWGALCIDMESHHAAQMAAENGLPLLAVRAIADHANEALPAIMASFVDADGATRMSAVLAALILGRVGLASLVRTGRASRRAHRALLRCRGALAGLG